MSRQRQFQNMRRQRDRLASAIHAHRVLWTTTGPSPSVRSDREQKLRTADKKLYARYDEVMGS